MKITPILALKAMEKFLDKFYFRDHSDDLGLILSDISLDTFLGEKTADPAAWEDWEDAIKIAKGGKVNSLFLTEKEAFKAMTIFLENFGTRIKSKEIKNLIDEIIDHKDNQSSIIWNFWLKCLEHFCK